MSNPFRKSPSKPIADCHQTTIPQPQSASEPRPSGATASTQASFNASNPFAYSSANPSTKTSLDQPKTASQPHSPSLRQDTPDLEAARPTPAVFVTEQLEQYRAANEHPASLPTTNSQTSQRDKADIRIGVKRIQSSTSVWPSRAELKKEAKLAKRERLRKNWHIFSDLPRKQRIAIQVLLALIAVCAAVGIGVGISRAVGGTTYKSEGQTEPLPNE